MHSAIQASSAHLAVIVRIARLDLTQVLTRQNACCARRVLGVVMLERTTSRPAEIVQPEDIRQPQEFRKRQGAIPAVLADSLLF